MLMKAHSKNRAEMVKNGFAEAYKQFEIFFIVFTGKLDQFTNN